MVTREVWDSLREIPHPSPGIYDFERAMQAPYMEIMQRGFKVNQSARHAAANELHERLNVLSGMLNEMGWAVWGKGVNPRSPLQLRELFYHAMHLPEVWLSQKGERKLSTNREALEKLEVYMHPRPIISCILAIRDIAKQLEVLETQIDSDGRFRAGYNIAGTETGRPSSSKNAFGTASNAQNISPALRFPFEADLGYRMCVIDLEQVEARDVGFFCGVLFDDWAFLDACESGDLHSSNARRIWPELPWTGDKKKDREIADRNFYREFSYRDMAKRGSHLSNYSGTAWTAARSLKVPLQIMENFQSRYCRGENAAFPCIARWWQWTAEQLQTKGYLTTPFGRTRHFFGRPDDDTTLREAIAFQPQSTTADRMNLGMWRVWKYMPEVQLLAQTYDSITFQYREDLDENSIISRAMELIRVDLEWNGRVYWVPGDAKVGWNWGGQVSEEDIAKARKKAHEAEALGLRPQRIPRLNPGGLVKWKPGFAESRTRITASSGLLSLLQEE